LQTIVVTMRKRYLKKIINYILNGLVITLPVIGTGYIIIKMLSWLDGLIPRFWYMGDEGNNPSGENSFTGIGILVLLMLLFIMGWLGSLFINDRLKTYFEKLLDKIPGVNNLYKTIQDILGAFVGNKKKFDQPVLVKVNSELDLEMIGFVTDTDLSELGNIEGKVAVYFPMSYSLSGHLLIVPVRNITKIERNSMDIMKYTMSGGIVEIEHDHVKKP
jgi:uncharacterized membrane protein